jgi:membrane protease YdiL (CAAX protease family)
VTEHQPGDDRPGSFADGPPPPPPPSARRAPAAPGSRGSGTATETREARAREAPADHAAYPPPSTPPVPPPPTPPAPTPAETRTRPSLADAIVLPIWVLAGQLVGGILILPVMIAQGVDAGISQEALLAITVVLGWTIVSVGLWGWLKLRRSWRGEWLTGHAPWSAWTASAAGVGAAVGGFVLVNIVVVTVTALTGVEPPQQEVFDLLSDPLLAWVIGATAVLAAPVIEEIVFRGVLMDVFQRWWGWWGAATVQAAVFSAVHIETLSSATMFFSLAMLGFIFAWLRRVTGSLVAPIVAHLVFNLVSLVISLTVGG